MGRRDGRKGVGGKMVEVEEGWEGGIRGMASVASEADRSLAKVFMQYWLGAR